MLVNSFPRNCLAHTTLEIQEIHLHNPHPSTISYLHSICRINIRYVFLSPLNIFWGLSVVSNTSSLTLLMSHGTLEWWSTPSWCIFVCWQLVNNRLQSWK